MSEKAHRYIGLAIWLSIIFIFWFFDFDQLFGEGSINISLIDSSVFEAIEQNIRYNYNSSYEHARDAAGVIWLVSLPVALYLAWRFRALPVRLIARFAKAFHRSV